MKTLNVTQSTIKAGYSPNNAYVMNSRLLRKDKVNKYTKYGKSGIMGDVVLSAKGI
ncbi:TPA: terminase small subunit [Staphylococcus delphini]|nr:terminase small subunit [Staphylococcus delphini]HEC2160929.1 terminase small subunit [Staphylococcus delphini]HEC2179070.1 terminase small subunit [Staphylococcus delphini]HEC2183514.1 terminase small subunit [Staphylococcus delphini]HEC2184798.1 terminase small subunit [Staphylococcus delphini]